MAELNALARWHVNAFARRRNARRYAWVRENLSLAPGAACLEIGCGNGGMAALLVEGLRPARWVATDLDPRQIQLAHRTLARRYPDGLPPSLELRTADMLQLPFPRGIVRCGLRLRRHPPCEPEPPRFFETSRRAHRARPGPARRRFPRVRGNRPPSEDPGLVARARVHAVRHPTSVATRTQRRAEGGLTRARSPVPRARRPACYDGKVSGTARARVRPSGRPTTRTCEREPA